MYLWLLAFAFALAWDFVAARWTIALTERRLTACVYSVLCSVLAFFSFYLCFTALELLIPTAAGHALGTWAAMRWSLKT